MKAMQMRLNLFLSTHSVRSATIKPFCGNTIYCISIHALRKECDFVALGRVVAVTISIHALRKECDQ